MFCISNGGAFVEPDNTACENVIGGEKNVRAIASYAQLHTLTAYKAE